MSAVPLGLVEDLELARYAVDELERNAAELWRAGGLAARTSALGMRREADAERAHVAELELELARLS